MSSSPHYCKCIWHCYPKYRKCVHFLLEWVNVSFYIYVVDIKLPCLSPLQRELKAKLLAEVAVLRDTEDSLLRWLALKKSAVRLIFDAITRLPFLPSLSFNQAPVGDQTSVLLVKDFLEFLHIEIHTLALLCMPYVLHWWTWLQGLKLHIMPC